MSYPPIKVADTRLTVLSTLLSLVCLGIMDDDVVSDFGSDVESDRVLDDESDSDDDHCMIDVDDETDHEPSSDENDTLPDDDNMEDAGEGVPNNPKDVTNAIPEDGRVPFYLEGRPIARLKGQKPREFQGGIQALRSASSPRTYNRSLWMKPLCPTCGTYKSCPVAPRKRVLNDPDTSAVDIMADSHRRVALYRFRKQKYKRRTEAADMDHNMADADQDASAEATKNIPVPAPQATVSKLSHAQASTGQTITKGENETAAENSSSSYPQTVYPPTVTFKNNWPTEGWGRMHELCDAAKQDGINALKETIHDYIPGGWPATSKQQPLSVPAQDAFWISDDDNGRFRDQVALMSGALPETPSKASGTVVPISPDGTQIPQVYSLDPEDRRMRKMSVVYDGRDVTLFWRSHWLPLHKIISKTLRAKGTVVKFVQGAMEVANSFKRRALQLLERREQIEPCRSPRRNVGPKRRSLRGLSEEERHKEKSRQWREARRASKPAIEPYPFPALSSSIAPAHPEDKAEISKRDVKRSSMTRPLPPVKDSRISKKRERRVQASSTTPKSAICRIAAGLKDILHRICGTKYPGVSKPVKLEPRHRRKPRRGEWVFFPSKFVLPWQRYLKPSVPTTLVQPTERPTVHDIPAQEEHPVAEAVAPLAPEPTAKVTEARPEPALRVDQPPTTKIAPRVEPLLRTEIAPHLHPEKIVHKDLAPITEPVVDQAVTRRPHPEVETALQNGIPEWLKFATPLGRPVSAVELFKPKRRPLSPSREESIFAPEWRKIEELDKEKRREGRRIRPEGPAVRPLSAKWEARLKEAMAQPNNRQLGTTLSGDPLTKRDLATCYTHMAWLNDEVINAYLALIVDYLRRSTGNAGRNVQPKFHAFNTFFFSNLRDRGYESVRRWASRAKIGGEKLLDVDTVFVPVHNSAHWTLMVIRPSARTIEHFDSLGSLSLAHVNKVKEWLRGELGPLYKDEEWTVLPSASPQQDNGSDCGVFLLSTAKAVAVGLEPLSYGPADIAMLRKKIVAELMHGRLEGEFDPAGESGEPRL